MPEMTSWTFGIEIEGVLRPHTLRLPINHAEYYMKLAAALRRRGLKSKADDLQGPYRKRADHYDKWWITRDGSLGTYNDAGQNFLLCADNRLLNNDLTN